MHIGMLTTGYPHVHDWVAGSFVREMSRALVARGHRVRVLCAERPGDRPVRDPGIEVIPVRYAVHPSLARTFYGPGAPDKLARFDPAAWLGALTFPIALLHRTRKELRTCDALVSHFVLPCSAIAGLVRDGRPHLAIGHGTDAILLARMPAAVQRQLLACTTVLRVTHHGLQTRLHPSVRNDPRIVVAPMGFTPAPALEPLARARLRAALGIGNEPTVLTVARLVPVKGIDVLIAATRHLTLKLSVVIAGDGPERPRLERAARKMGAAVRFVGAVDAPRRDALLGIADVFVLPSRPLPDGRTEGAPVALLEAMGAGLAVVASNTGGIAELTADAAMLVPPGNPEALAHAIEALIRDPAQRAALGDQARKRAAPWTWQNQIQWIEQVLASH